MLRLSKLADYAVVVLARLADGEAVQNAAVIAAATHLPEPTVAKVLKGLAGAGLVVSSRGARGGYRLQRPVETISVAEVVGAIDGPVHLAACVEGSSAPCEASDACACRGGWDHVNEVVRRALDTISIADVAANRAPPGPILPAPEFSEIPAPTLLAE